MTSDGNSERRTMHTLPRKPRSNTRTWRRLLPSERKVTLREFKFHEFHILSKWAFFPSDNSHNSSLFNTWIHSSNSSFWGWDSSCPICKHDTWESRGKWSRVNKLLAKDGRESPVVWLPRPPLFLLPLAPLASFLGRRVGVGTAPLHTLQTAPR